MPDPWILLAAMATLTQRIRLGVLVTPLARRQPFAELLARVRQGPPGV